MASNAMIVHLHVHFWMIANTTGENIMSVMLAFTAKEVQIIQIKVIFDVAVFTSS